MDEFFICSQQIVLLSTKAILPLRGEIVSSAEKRIVNMQYLICEISPPLMQGCLPMRSWEIGLTRFQKLELFFSAQFIFVTPKYVAREAILTTEIITKPLGGRGAVPRTAFEQLIAFPKPLADAKGLVTTP